MHNQAEDRAGRHANVEAPLSLAPPGTRPLLSEGISATERLTPSNAHSTQGNRGTRSLRSSVMSQTYRARLRKQQRARLLRPR